MTAVDGVRSRSGRKPKSASQFVPKPIEVNWPEAVVYSAHELKLIEGTYDLMAQIGAQQLSLRRTARELDVSPGLLKYHFGDQEKLLLETMRWVLQNLLEKTRECLDGVTDPINALSGLLDIVFGDPASFHQLQLVSLDMAQYVARHPGFSELADLLITHNEVYGAVIRAGMESGAFQVDDVDVAIFQVRAVIMGGGQQWIQQARRQKSLNVLRKRCFDTILILLGVESPRH